MGNRCFSFSFLLPFLVGDEWRIRDGGQGEALGNGFLLPRGCSLFFLHPRKEIFNSFLLGEFEQCYILLPHLCTKIPETFFREYQFSSE